MKYVIRKIFFTIFSALSIGISIYFSFWVINPTMVGIWLTMAIFIFSLGWPELAESISFLGSSIKLREIKETITELKKLAEINSKALLELIQAKGRSTSSSLDAFDLKIYENIDEMLTDLKFSPEEIEKIQSRWHHWVEHDYISYLISPFSNINHPAVPKENHNEWHIKREEILNQKNDIDNIRVQPDDLREIFRKLDGYSDTVRRIIDDFEYYRKNKKHRDLEYWKKRANWFKT